MTMIPICIPEDWDDNGLILFEEFCELICIPQRTGRLYVTVGEIRRFIAAGTTTQAKERSDG